MRFNIRYKIDMTVQEGSGSAGKGKDNGEPIGQVTKFSGSLDQIKEKILDEIEKTANKIKELYYGEE